MYVPSKIPDFRSTAAAIAEAAGAATNNLMAELSGRVAKFKERLRGYRVKNDLIDENMYRQYVDSIGVWDQGDGVIYVGPNPSLRLLDSKKNVTTARVWELGLVLEYGSQEQGIAPFPHWRNFLNSFYDFREVFGNDLARAFLKAMKP